MPTDAPKKPLGPLDELGTEMKTVMQQIRHTMPAVKKRWTKDYGAVELYVEQSEEPYPCIAHISPKALGEKLEEVVVVMRKDFPDYESLRSAILLGTAPWLTVTFKDMEAGAETTD